ncbi:MAG TPA: chemotaxis response regulator protein-glutamate methylesterase [Longimicrobiales bacterium]|nr:chemotaxis response regulator protein-glutamate methylesterase [Longimicrobiales bacterium]
MKAPARQSLGGIRLLAVDDSAFVLKAVERMVAEWDDVRLVGTARDGADAISQAAALEPDVIVMDVSMPIVDGLQALERIMAERPVPIILFSSLTKENADVTLRGLELGAVDFVDKGSVGSPMDIHTLAPALHDKIRGAAGASPASPRAPLEGLPAVQPPTARGLAAESAYDVIVVGTSTGGPRALGRILPRLPADFGAAVVVVQHMPEGFTRSLADRLDRLSAIEVREAADAVLLRPGVALIAPAGLEFTVEGTENGLRARVRPPSGDYRHDPSVNGVLMSVARAAGRRAIGVILTGMGEDGAEGLRALREAGGRTIAESRNTTVIDGMPRAARPAAEFVAPLDSIPQMLVDLCAGRVLAARA